tara:strand:- start:67 stop:525 length:459 start_codon:yes stop_codon:yes gene_type:complete
MYKKVFILLFTLFILNGCGYAPIYSKTTNNELNLELISFDGDREINKAIRYNLERYANKNNKNKFIIKTTSNYIKNAGTKNLAGNVTSYNIAASVNFQITSTKINKEFQFSETSAINNQNNQLDETIYEENIKKNFAELFSKKLILQLLKIK